MLSGIFYVIFAISICCLWLAFLIGCLWVIITLATWSLWTLLVTVPIALFLVSAIIVFNDPINQMEIF